MNPCLAYHSECVQFLQKLIQTPSVNLEIPEAAIVKVIEEEAKKLELPYQIFEKAKGRPNIFVGNPESFSSKNSLLLVAHTDTVPVGDASKWKFSPFSGEIDKNRLYGRGAVDCKGGIALSLYALKILKDSGQLHRAKFLGVADEESGASSDLGLKYVLEQGLDARGAIYTYGGGDDLYQSLNIGHRGVVRAQVTFTGESVHSGSIAWQNRTQGSNAIDPLIKFIQSMNELDFQEENPYFPGYRFTSTPTILNAGIGESIVPDRSAVLYDIRTLPGQTGDKIIKKIEEIARNKSTLGFKVETKTNVPAALSDPHAPFIQRITRLHKDIFGNEPVITGSGPANESYMLIERGIPAVAGYGPKGGGFHALNEYADIETLKNSLQFLVCLASDET